MCEGGSNLLRSGSELSGCTTREALIYLEFKLSNTGWLQGLIFLEVVQCWVAGESNLLTDRVKYCNEVHVDWRDLYAYMDRVAIRMGEWMIGLQSSWISLLSAIHVVLSLGFSRHTVRLLVTL